MKKLGTKSSPEKERFKANANDCKTNYLEIFETL